MMSDCNHWIPVMQAEAERERDSARAEVERLRRLIAHVRDVTDEAEKPKYRLEDLFFDQARQQQRDAELMKMQRNYARMQGARNAAASPQGLSAFGGAWPFGIGSILK